MRPEPNIRVEEFRVVPPTRGKSDPGANWGAFRIGQLNVISSGTPQGAEPPWEHVSVSTGHRCPSWEEMVRIKELFWTDDETVIQFHPAKAHAVNVHPYCLHLWRRIGLKLELPPRNLIA